MVCKKGEDAILRGKGPIPSVFPVGYDGIAFIINKSNLDSCITVTDVKRLLRGDVTKWNQIYPHSKNGNIEVVFDNKSISNSSFCC